MVLIAGGLRRAEKKILYRCLSLITALKRIGDFSRKNVQENDALETQFRLPRSALKPLFKSLSGNQMLVLLCKFPDSETMLFYHIFVPSSKELSMAILLSLHNNPMRYIQLRERTPIEHHIDWGFESESPKPSTVTQWSPTSLCLQAQMELHHSVVGTTTKWPLHEVEPAANRKCQGGTQTLLSFRQKLYLIGFVLKYFLAHMQFSREIQSLSCCGSCCSLGLSSKAVRGTSPQLIPGANESESHTAPPETWAMTQVKSFRLGRAGGGEQ